MSAVPCNSTYHYVLYVNILDNLIVKLRVRVRVRVRVEVKVKSQKSKLDPELGSVMG